MTPDNTDKVFHINLLLSYIREYHGYRSSWIAFECEALCCVQNLDSTEDTKAVTVKKKQNLVVHGHIPVYFHKFVIDCTFFKRSHLIMNLHVDSRNI